MLGPCVVLLSLSLLSTKIYLMFRACLPPAVCLFTTSQCFSFVFMTIILVPTKSNGLRSVLVSGWCSEVDHPENPLSSHLIRARVNHARGGMGRRFIGWILPLFFSIWQKKTRVVSWQKKTQAGGKGAQLTSIDFGLHRVLLCLLKPNLRKTVCHKSSSWWEDQSTVGWDDCLIAG